MSKYGRLAEYLQHQSQDELTLSFFTIEQLIRQPLPRASQSAEWWESAEDGPRKHVQQLAWRAVGFNAYLRPGGRVVFVRTPGADNKF